MNAIDIRIFLTGYALSMLLCTIVIASLWWQNRKRSPEISLWLANFILQFTGALLITSRGILPDFFSIIIANVFIIGGTTILYIGLGRYVGKECRQLHNYVMLVAFTLVLLYLTYLHPDFSLRVVNLSIAFIFICAQCAWLLLRKVEPDMLPITRVTGIIFAALCLFGIIQVIANLTIPEINDLLLSGLLGIFIILTYQISFIALSIALFLMVNRRLSTELESELLQRTQTAEELRQSEEKFSKAFQTSPYAIGITRMADGKFIEVNDAFATLTGYSREEAMAKSSIGLNLWVSQKDREEMVAVLRQGLPVIDREFLFRRKNGKVIIGSFSAQSIQLDQEPCLLSSINDITERKQVERNLKKSLQLLRDAGAMANIGGWELNVATQDQVWTEEIYRIHEVDRNFKPTASKGIDFYTLASRPIIELAVQRAIEHGEPFDLELEIITAKGNLRWVHTVGKADQEHGKILGVFQDITERKRAENEIRLNETRLKSLLNILQYRTKTTQEFLDYALDEVIKLTQSKIGYIYFYHEDRRQFVLNTWSKDVMKECTIVNPQTCYALEKTGIWGEAVRQRKPIILNDFQTDHPLQKGYPEGHAHLSKFATVPVMKDDKIVAVVGVANKERDYDETDVLQLTLFMDSVWKSVDIKMAEEKLRESEEKFKQLAEVFPETIFEANLKGDLTYGNEHGLKHFGLTEEDIAKGINIFAMVSPNDRNLTQERIQTRIKGSEQRYLEYKALKKDGSTFDALALSVPIIVDGIPVGIRGFILDITERKQAEEALRKSEIFLNTLLNSIPIPVFYKDRDGRYTGFNRAFENFFGTTKEQLIGKTAFDINPPELAKIYHAKDNEIFESGSEQYYEAEVKDVLGVTRNVIFNKAALIDSQGKVSGLIGAILDITERKQNEGALRESEERLSAITNSAHDAIIMMDNNGNISYWNPAAECIIGYTKEEAVGKDVHKLIAPERFLPAYFAAFPEFQKTGRGNVIGKTLELTARRKDGNTIDVALSLSTVNIKGAWHAVGIIQNITERKQAEKQIQHLATHDLLTDLPSLRLAKDHLNMAINMARRNKTSVAVMFIDLDGFKAVNDTLGHDAGDYMLQQVAQRLLSCVRETDTVTRVGGDEFLIIATEINSPENVAQIAEKVIQLVSQPLIIKKQRAVVGASIGIALFPGDSKDMDQLIKQADEAMYKVKNAGKNGFCFVKNCNKTTIKQSKIN